MDEPFTYSRKNLSWPGKGPGAGWHLVCLTGIQDTKASMAAGEADKADESGHAGTGPGKELRFLS